MKVEVPSVDGKADRLVTAILSAFFPDRNGSYAPVGARGRLAGDILSPGGLAGL